MPYTWNASSTENILLRNTIHKHRANVKRQNEKGDLVSSRTHVFLEGTMCVCLVASDSILPPDSSPPGSSVRGVLQARTLEWVAIFSSRGSSWPRDWIWVSWIAGKFFTFWATREAMAGTTWPLHLIIYSSEYIARKFGNVLCLLSDLNKYNYSFIRKYSFQQPFIK